MNPWILKFSMLLFFLPFVSFSQDNLIRKDSVSRQADSVLKKIDSVAKVVKKVVVDSLEKRKKVKIKSDFHFFKDVFEPLDSTKKKKLPKIALFRSLILPGWGQATNHQIWVIPIIYAGVAGGVYSVIWNNNKYQFYRGYLYDALVDAAANPSSTGVLIEGRGPFTSDRITPAVNAYRRQRDLTYIVFAVGWLLQAVQANVQAHLKTFDMSENLSLRFEPSIQPTFGSAAIGISAKLYLK